MTKNNQKIVAVSGGFDPVHVGHLRLFKEARKLGDKLIVFLNQDHFLMNKKGFVFMPFEERKEILENFSVVDEVLPVIDSDVTVCETLKKYKPDIFANGGDRHEKTTPEYDTCNELGIEMCFRVVGQIQSSSKLVKNAKGNMNT